MESKIQQHQTQKTSNKKLYYFIIIAIVAYGAYKMATHEPKMQVDVKATIDSLNKVNADLIEHQKQIDSIIAAEQYKIDQVDNQIHNIKEKTTIIKEYYHEISNKVNNYDAVQIDSFFKSRYNYQ